MKKTEGYICEACEQFFEYDKKWSDEDAKEEAKILFGDIKDLAIICDSCFNRGMIKRKLKGKKDYYV